MLQITIDAKEIKDAATIALRGIGANATKTSMPVLGSLHLKCVNNLLTVTGTNLEQWMSVTAPLSGFAAEDGETCVQAKNFVELISDMGGSSSIQITGEEAGGATLKTGKSKYKLNGYAGSLFPLTPEHDPDLTFEISEVDIKQALLKVFHCVSTDETRMILTGVLLSVVGGQLTFVATDTHRLGKFDGAPVEVVYKADKPIDMNVIIPSPAVGDILKILSNSQSPVKIELDKNRIRVTTQIACITSRLIDGQYPNFERVIPKDSDKSITIGRELLHSAVKRAMVVARDSSNRLVFNITGDEDGGKVELSTISGNIGTGNDIIECQVNGVTEPLAIALNGRYLLGILESMTLEKIRIDLTEPLKPAVWRQDSLKNYLCVLMPMQVV